jgi:hypothetical protein
MSMISANQNFDICKILKVILKYRNDKDKPIIKSIKA